jgi:hypothetical protein
MGHRIAWACTTQRRQIFSVQEITMGFSTDQRSSGRQPMSAAHMLALLFLLLTAGCTGMERPASQTPSPAGATSPGATTAVETTPGPAEQAAHGATGDGTSASAAQRPAQASPAPAAAPTPARKGAAATGMAKPAAEPPLDLALLEQRLRETEAIGVFTKIALKNQVDDLLGKFRAFYQGKARTSLAELRQPYDMLLLKVLTLLQDSDPGLARSIVASREVIWGMLADPDKFATL